MKHMMLYEKWHKKPMILFLHGLDGEIDNKQEKTKEIGRDWGSGEQKKDIIRD